ncbi:response regulator [Zhouia amylolytica]|uniref:response regulator n=1 Tax=Zhouia amylolytica TaxID=376730 RepID=UPI00057083DE|nr:response regulator transcription factor [Zhouia amylolytica]
MPEIYRILVVDDHKMFLEGITAILNQEEHLEIIGIAYNGIQALNILKEQTPDLIITDIEMPGLNGISFVKAVRSFDTTIKILAISSHQSSATIHQSIKAGVNGYILKNSGKVTLLKAIAEICSGHRFFPQSVQAILNNSIFKKDNSNQNIILSNREKEILKLIAREYSTQEIADTLCVSKNTIETHRKNLMRKTEAKNMIGLVKYAIKTDLI